MPVEMKALKGFANKRIENGGKRGDGSVLPGETFATDWLHAKELSVGKIAEPVNAADLDKEPTDDLVGDNQLSVPQLAVVNDRRRKARDAAAGATGTTKV